MPKKAKKTAQKPESKAPLYGTLFFVVIILNALIAVAPTLWFTAPITQTDGSYYYSIAKAWAQGTSDSEVYGFITSVGSVKDYPPALVWFYKVLLQNNTPDHLIYNGFFIAVLFVIGNVFLYRLVRDLTNYTTAILVLTIATFNIRSYYMLFGGIHPTLAGISLGFIGLYFFYHAVTKKCAKAAVATIVVTTLVALTHFATVLYLMLLQLCIFGGYLLKNHATIQLPKVSFDLKKFSFKNLWPLALFIVPVITLLYGMLPKSSALENTGSSNYLKLWIQSLLNYGPGGYQNVWEVFPLFDGPILFTLGLIGLVVFFFSQKWIPFTMIVGSWLFVLSEHIFLPQEDVWIVHYIHNFYPVLTVMMAVSCCYCISLLREQKNLKWLAIVLVAAMVGFQAVKLGGFLSFIEPAIDEYEIDAARFVREGVPNSEVFFLDNGDYFGWRNFHWVAVFSESQKPTISQFMKDLDTETGYDAIVIGDNTRLSEEDLARLTEYEKVYENGHVSIYS